MRMATVAQNLPQSSDPLTWVQEFLKQELAPYPGRAALVARMTIAATLVMIICMTFRLSFAFQGAVFTLLISRQNPRATLQSGTIIFLATGTGAAYLLASAWIVISFPLLHFLWVIASFWLAFYAISALRDYTVTVNFAMMIAIGVPLWDRHVSAETNVEDTLRLCLAVLIGVATTAAVEHVCARLRPGDDVVVPVIERLAAVESLLMCYAEDRNADPATEQKIARLGVLGTSMLRRSLRRADYSSQYSVEMGGVAALAGRLVDLATTSIQLNFDCSANDQRRFRSLASTLATIRVHLTNREIPGPVQFDTVEQSYGVAPLLREMEDTATLIPEAFSGSLSVREYLPSADNLPRATLLAPDAFVNPEHVHFALKGCLAASSCYLIYNAIAWPGISTAVTTCLLTALTTIGSSHQKQILPYLWRHRWRVYSWYGIADFRSALS